MPSSLAIDILEENERSIEQQLTSMRFATVEPQPKPTVLGVLVVGPDPRQFLPGAYIQFLRIDGSELTDPIRDQKEIGGSLPDLLRLLDATLQVHISVATDITAQPIEMRQPDYPIVALQQLARNAVMHRIYEGTYAPVRITWFNDCIEIQNPGGPFGQVNKQNFGQPGVTDYRNPHLAEAMKNLGYVQRFGVGIQLARKELQKNGNPPPEFAVEDAHLLVTPSVYHEDVLDQPLTDNISVADDRHCLALLKNYQSLMPMAQEARKPIFHLKPADGAIGAHTYAVRNVYREFEKLARAIAQRTGVKQLSTPTATPTAPL